MNKHNLPKCECGVTTGISLHGNRMWCSLCMWRELKRLEEIVDILPKNEQELPIVSDIDPGDETAERLGIEFRYVIEK